MALSNEDRVLRLTLIASFLVGVAFIIPYTIHAHNVVPSIGLVPAGLSAITSLYHFSGIARHRKFNILLDSFLASFFLAMYIAATVTVAQHWNLRMLGTYGTIPLLMGFLIHTYLVLRDTAILEIARFHISALISTPQCPHCQHKILSTWGMSPSRTPSSSRSRSNRSYAALDAPDEGEEDETPVNITPRDYKDASPTRGSIDEVDESTRLV